MKSRYQSILLSSVLLVVFLFFWRATRETDELEVAAATQGQATTEYDYYLDEVITTRFTTTGAKLYKLEAAQITHFPNGNRAELTFPDFTRYPPGSNPVRMTARAGSLVPGASAEADILMLRNDVVLERTLDNGQPLTMNTSSLNMNTGTGTASTPDLVTIDTANSHISGVGMRITQNENRIELLADVRGQHE